jgi:hypothetical protein
MDGDGLLVPWDSALSMTSRPFNLLLRLARIKVFCPLPVWSLLTGTNTVNSRFHCRIRNLEAPGKRQDGAGGDVTGPDPEASTQGSTQGNDA